jgi:hypothetical protein
LKAHYSLFLFYSLVKPLFTQNFFSFGTPFFVSKEKQNKNKVHGIGAASLWRTHRRRGLLREAQLSRVRCAAETH